MAPGKPLSFTCTESSAPPQGESPQPRRVSARSHSRPPVMQNPHNTLWPEDVHERQLAFTRMWSLHESKLSRFLRSRFSNPDDVSDALQQTALKAWAGLLHFRGEASLATWLERIALNEARAFYRKRARHNVSFSPWPDSTDDLESNPLECAATASHPLESLLRQESEQHLRVQVRALPQKLRIVVEEAILGELTSAEGAERLALSEACVKTRRFRALARLRSSWRQETLRFRISGKARPTSA